MNITADVSIERESNHITESIQMIDSLSISRISKDQDLKTLFKGFKENSDLFIVVLDSLDCDFRTSKIGTFLKKASLKGK